MNFSFCKEMGSTVLRFLKDEYLIPLTPFSRLLQYDTMSSNMLRSSCLGIFITAGVFFATFFFKKKVDPIFIMQSLLFLLLAQKKETKKRALAIEKTPKILLQP